MKDFHRHDLLNDPTSSWVDNLPVNLQCISAQCSWLQDPFEVYYCRNPLGLTKPLLEDIKEMNSTSNSRLGNYRESWDPYSGLENPRFHMYEVDLHNVQEETGASASL